MELLLPNAAVGLAHQDQLMTRDVVFLDRLGNDSLGITVGINVCGVPLSMSHQLSAFPNERGKPTVLSPRS